MSVQLLHVPDQRISRSWLPTSHIVHPSVVPVQASLEEGGQMGSPVRLVGTSSLNVDILAVLHNEAIASVRIELCCSDCQAPVGTEVDDLACERRTAQTVQLELARQIGTGAPLTLGPSKVPPTMGKINLSPLGPLGIASIGATSAYISYKNLRGGG